MSTQFRVLSLNVGLLDIRDPIFGYTLFENPAYARERLPFIPEALREIDADIVLLQECYYEKDAAFLRNNLEGLYPHISRQDCPRTWLQLHNGLMLMSKLPIIQERLDKFRDAAWLEWAVACKSNLITTIQLGQRHLTFINGHYTAGGERINSDDPNSDLDREKELAQAVIAAHTAAQAGEIPFLCGDFNCGPEASISNYRGLLHRGFRDLFAEANGLVAEQGGPETFTWNPTNYLNTIGPHAHCPGQRLDHLFLPSDLEGASAISCGSARIVFSAPCVRLRNGQLCTLSDHSGVVWDLTLT